MKQKNYPACPLIHSKKVEKLCQIEDFKVWRCPESAIDFVWPIPALTELNSRDACLEGAGKVDEPNYDEQDQPSLTLAAEIINRFPQNGATRYVLDVGCGYGTRLSLAAERGWKCFGIETSEHARHVATQRHGERIFLVEKVSDLIPHQFELVLMMDVLQHLADPYTFMFDLFSKGAIGPETLLVITTPNARSTDALVNPKDWVNRHLPSHLLYFSGESLQIFLQRLRFSSIQISGTSPLLVSDDAQLYRDEHSVLNEQLRNYASLLCESKGSDFVEFMQERYVPGTWSKIAEYEHLPRYLFAKSFATNARILDFGCGTGYGSAALAEVANSVLGLDIDKSALRWAEQAHKNKSLHFEHRDDLGAGLEDQSFDLVTCFEMIEHVVHETQIETIRNISRLLTLSGKLVISTPNSEVTALYGENPYHLREMSEQEFFNLLIPHFKHVHILRQWIAPSVLIAEDSCPNQQIIKFDKLLAENIIEKPLAYIAICSQAPIEGIAGLCEFDRSLDFIQATLENEKSLNHLRFEAYTIWEQKQELLQNIRGHEKTLKNRANAIAELEQRVIVVAELEQRILVKEVEIQTLRSSKMFRLADTIRNQPMSLHKLWAITYLIGAIVLPDNVKARLKRSVPNRVMTSSSSVSTISPYQVRNTHSPALNRPRIMHLIANFMTGGSSRLVVDLIEQLGNLYDQEVITSFIPNPPAYIGLTVIECHNYRDAVSFRTEIERFQPDLVHVHYWGNVDYVWYDMVINVAQQMGCKVLENINTPIKPYISESVTQYVYVSRNVLDTFADKAKENKLIYPGSDFSRFKRSPGKPVPQDCIGMVYRLESDKLNEQSIQPFIKVARRRPNTKILIVGGGSLLKPFQNTVKRAGLTAQFEFAGYIAYEDLPAIYERMSIFVAPVWKESFGQVTPFAMNMGIPCVGYDVGALLEIVGNEALLAPAENSTKLADIIIELLDDPGRCAEIGKFNQQRASELFSIEVMIEAYRKLYAELLTE